MREAKPEWIVALRALTGQERDTIRFNETVGRWEFQMVGASGEIQSQFWGVYHDPVTGQRVRPDEATGMYAFRELDDAGMREALANLERTFVGNRVDGAGTVRKHLLKGMRYNRQVLRKHRSDRADLFVDMVADRGQRMRGAVQIVMPGTLAAKAPSSP